MKSNEVVLEDATVEFPIFNANARSLTSRVLEVATGGKLDRDPSGRVIVRSLNKVNLRIQDGERVGLIGHNGAGKSTLLRVIAGVYSPTSGVSKVEGKVSSLIDIGLGINPEASGRENIFLRGQLLGMSNKAIRMAFNEVIDFAELGEFIEMPLRTYSTGMQMRLAFAISTILDPSILVMDEWLSVGDENFVRKAELRLKNYVDKSQILVIASHSQSLLRQLCTRVLWLDHGEVKMDDAPDKVLKEYFS